MTRRRTVLAAAVVAVLVTGAAAPPELTRDDFPEVTEEMLPWAVEALGENALDRAVEALGANAYDRALEDYEGRIRPLATREETPEETVVTLATDILFAVDDATLSDAAATQVGVLVAEVPDGATVVVEGHTDSVASDDYNQALSERRAAAVADAVRAARPDLAVTPQGFGESRPKVAESGDDVDEARAQNRRVEMRYATAPAGSTASPRPTPTPVASVPPRTGTTPRVRPAVGDADVVGETRVPAPGYPGAEVVVKVEGIEVRGAATLLAMVVELDGKVPADPRGLFTALGSRSWRVALVDRENLLQYTELKYLGQIEWVDEGDVVSTYLTEPRRFVLAFPRLLDDLEVVDVVLDPEHPAVVDVPVTYE